VVLIAFRKKNQWIWWVLNFFFLMAKKWEPATAFAWQPPLSANVHDPRLPRALWSIKYYQTSSSAPQPAVQLQVTWHYHHLAHSSQRVLAMNGNESRASVRLLQPWSPPHSTQQWVWSSQLLPQIAYQEEHQISAQRWGCVWSVLPRWTALAADEQQCFPYAPRRVSLAPFRPPKAAQPNPTGSYRFFFSKSCLVQNMSNGCYSSRERAGSTSLATTDEPKLGVTRSKYLPIGPSFGSRPLILIQI
jgi:hypothetical protein